VVEDGEIVDGIEGVEVDTIRHGAQAAPEARLMCQPPYDVLDRLGDWSF
jgi:hypothetical protein